MSLTSSHPAIASETGFQIRGSLLARNTVLNFICAAAPLLIGVITLPYVIGGLGVDRFGILSLAWVLAGYLGFLNLGLGPATTKFVAELLGKGQAQRLPALIWTSLSVSAILGTIGGVTLAAATLFLIGRLFKLSPSLGAEARVVFLLIAISLPVVFTMNSLRGVLEAAQRFDLVNAVNLPLNSANFLVPAIAVLLGFGLPAIVGFLVVSRFAAALAYFALSLRIFPNLHGQPFFLDPKVLRPLLGFGGWVSIGGVIGPIVTYLDRFLIGALISMAAVGYYAAPYEAVMRSAVLPGALVGVLFPAFSTLGGGRQLAEVENLFVRSIRYLLLAVGPFAILLVLYARQILEIWLGPDFARQSTLAFQILPVGMLLSSILWIPHVLLQAVGRPDLSPKFVLLVLPLYVGLAWLLISRLGITGAALAFALRVGLQGVLLFAACTHLRLASLRSWASSRMMISLAMLVGLAAALAGLPYFGRSWPTNAGFAVFLLLLFGVAGWRYALDPGERTGLRTGLGQLPPSVLPRGLRDAR